MAKDPAGRPVLIIAVVGIIGFVVYLLVKPKLSATTNGSAASQNQEERRKGLLARLSKSLPNSGISPIPLKPGEALVYKLQKVSLIESRSNGSTYQGGSRGVSLRIAKGVSYRIGASKGQLLKNPESLQLIDQGTATFTNKRLIFAGMKASREWSFDKMTDVSQSADGQTVMISVSNRQKPSGITSNDLLDLGPGVIVAIALEYNQNGIQAAKDRCLTEAGISEAPNGASPDEGQSPRNAELDEADPTRATSVAAPSVALAAKPLAYRIEAGDDLLEVVGESFYAEAFEILRERYSIDFDETQDFEMDLVAEPFNKYSENGHAVAVQLDGQIIGHISEDENTEFFELLKTCNGRAKCQGEIYFAPVTDLMRNSVRIFCNFPPTLESIKP